MSRVWPVAFCLMILDVGLCAEQAARKPLADGLFLLDVDGRLVHDDVNDVWLLDLTADVNMPGVQVPAETEFPLLASAALESMIDDSNDRVLPLYRLSALVTQYEGKNYLLPAYYLAMSQLKGSNEPQKESGRKPATGEPNTTLPIPAEIREILKNRLPLRGQQRLTPLSPAQSAPARTLVNVVGFIEQRQGRAVFVPDALGLGVSAREYVLLPNAMLEQARRLQAASPDRVRFSVAGLLHEFEGKHHLLLQRVVRMYSYGDFTG
jgi:hypothetical protein